MQCRDARELLDSFLGQELLVETNHELLRHINGCADCRAELEARSRLRASLRRAFGRAADLQMRPEFAAEIAGRVRAAAFAPPGRLWKPGWLALAASVLLVAAAGLYVMLVPRPSALERQAAGDHRNCAVQFRLTERPIPLAEAAARYDPAYAVLQHAPPDAVPTAAGALRVADRHSCVFDTRRFGHVVFRLDGHVVSVLMTADGPGDETAAPAGRQLSWLPSVDSLSMASFRTPGHVVFIVSDLPDTPFRQVAQSLADPLSRVMAILGNIPTSTGD